MLRTGRDKNIVINVPTAVIKCRLGKTSVCFGSGFHLCYELGPQPIDVRAIAEDIADDICAGIFHCADDAHGCARLVFHKPLHRENDICYTCVHPPVGEPRDVAIVVMNLTIVVMSICDARKMSSPFSTAIIVPFDRLFSTATIISFFASCESHAPWLDLLISRFMTGLTC